MHTKEFIKEQLSAMGAPRDKVVIVHTSLHAIGETEGRGQGLLDALIEYFTSEGGLLCIPTHTWDNLGKRRKITLDMTKPRSCLGVLPCIAAGDKRGVRTPNPTHSMVVFGESDKVAEFVRGEERENTPTSAHGCYSKIYENDGYILLIGIGQEKNTFIHCVEDMMGMVNRIDTAHPIDTTIKYKSGEIEHRRFYSFNEDLNGDVSIYFPKYEAAFKYRGALSYGKLGDAFVHLCSARKIKETMELIRERSGGVELLYDDEPLKEEWYM